MFKSRYLCLAVCHCVYSLSFGVIVFQDDFNGTNGTASTPETGGSWTTGKYKITGNALDSRTSADFMSAAFTRTLGAGEILTLTFTTSGGAFKADEALGFTLYDQDTAGEGLRNASVGKQAQGTVWLGHPGFGSGTALSSDIGVVATLTYTYTFDTGAWTLHATDGMNSDLVSGTDTAGHAMNSLQFMDRTTSPHNASNDSFLLIDSVSADISAVPEPATTAVLLGLGALGVVLYRRRKR